MEKAELRGEGYSTRMSRTQRALVTFKAIFCYFVDFRGILANFDRFFAISDEQSRRWATGGVAAAMEMTGAAMRYESREMSPEAARKA